MRTPIKIVCGLFVLLTAIAACGQKGPLFLPDDPATVQTDVPGQYQSEPSTEDADDDADSEDEDGP
jgi:predicted small lipoprotein YifL